MAVAPSSLTAVMVMALAIAVVIVKHFVRRLPAREGSNPLFLMYEDLLAVRRAFEEAQTDAERSHLHRLLLAIYTTYAAFPLCFLISFLLMLFTVPG